MAMNTRRDKTWGGYPEMMAFEKISNIKIICFRENITVAGTKKKPVYKTTGYSCVSGFDKIVDINVASIRILHCRTTEFINDLNHFKYLKQNAFFNQNIVNKFYNDYLMDMEKPLYVEKFINKNQPEPGKAKAHPEEYKELRELERWSEYLLYKINDMDVYSYCKKNNCEKGTFYYPDADKLNRSEKNKEKIYLNNHINEKDGFAKYEKLTDNLILETGESLRIH